MKIFCLGLNHETAPVEVREKFAVSGPKQGESSKVLMSLPGVKEAVLLSTCNRMEIYAAADDVQQAHATVREYLSGHHDLASEEMSHFYEVLEVDAARHLCEVVSGLDSMVLGETEIFGQVKQAYQQALNASATGGTLNKLFQKSFTVGKKVRTETKIQEGQTSVGSVAVDLAEKIFGHLKNSKVMVIGAGEMSRNTALSLKLRGAKSIFVANRSHDRAVALAEELEGEAVKFEEWEKVMEKVDVVISSTGAPHAVVLAEHVESVRKKRKYRPIFFIDIAVPRDIDSAVGDIEEVYLYDMDSLQQLANDSVSQRQMQVKLCREIIEREVADLQDSLSGRRYKRGAGYDPHNA